eukprot:702082_1
MSLLIWLSAVVGTFSLFSIGSNGVANTQATAVGSGALSLTAAQILAAICEFLGAVLVGYHVSNTVGDEIVTDDHISDVNYCWGMFSALCSAGSWILLCSFLKMPASSTHSIIGSLIGFNLVITHFDVYSLNFELLGHIVTAWITTPLMSGFLTYVSLFLLDWYWPRASRVKDPLRFGLIFGILCTTLVLFVMIAGPQQIVLLFADYPTSNFMGLIFIIFVATALIATAFEYFVNRTTKTASNKSEVELLIESNTLSEIPVEPVNATDAYFKIYLAISSGAVAFAHGGNDIANVLGPFSQIWSYEMNGNLDENTLPVYVSGIGGIFIAIGFYLFGKNILDTVGEKITGLTFRTGFAAQFSSALTVLTCDVFGLPVSSSTVIVGAVTGVSFYKNRNKQSIKTTLNKKESVYSAIDFKLLSKILLTWAVTIPANAIMCGTIYSLLNALLL